MARAMTAKPQGGALTTILCPVCVETRITVDVRDNHAPACEGCAHTHEEGRA